MTVTAIQTPFERAIKAVGNNGSVRMSVKMTRESSACASVFRSWVLKPVGRQEALHRQWTLVRTMLVLVQVQMGSGHLVRMILRAVCSSSQRSQAFSETIGSPRTGESVLLNSLVYC